MGEPQRCWVSGEVWRGNLATLGRRARRMAAGEQRTGTADLAERLRLAGEAIWLLAPAISDPLTVARSCEASCRLGVPVLLVDAPVDERVESTLAMLMAAQGADLSAMVLPHPPAQLPTDRLSGSVSVPLPAIGRPPAAPEPQAVAVHEPPPQAPDPESGAPSAEQPLTGWVPTSELPRLCPLGRSQGAALAVLRRRGGDGLMRRMGGRWLVHAESAAAILAAARKNKNPPSDGDAVSREPAGPAGLDQLLRELRGTGEP